MPQSTKKVKWFCLNGNCDFSTHELDKFVEHLKEEHGIYIDYEIDAEG